MPTTSVYNLPYPGTNDEADVPADMEALAEAVETELVRIDDDIDDLETNDPWGGAVSVQVSQATAHSNITSTTFTAGTANCEATFVAPPSGKVWIHVGGNGGGTTTSRILVSFEIRATNVGGSVITAAADANGVLMDCVSGAQQAWPTLISSLTPGATYYVRTMHKTLPSGTTGDLYTRMIGVQPTV